MPPHPKAFISYSWDNEAHKEWVRQLATQLRADGVDARLDYWHTIPGDQLSEFMEREIRNSDYVIIVCTPGYKAKSEARLGGVGYEGGIMSAEVFLKQNHRKFIPVLARGPWTEASPSWLVGSRHIDLSDAARYAAGYNELKKTILGIRDQAPPLGPLPVGCKPPARSQSDEPVRSKPQGVNLELFAPRIGKKAICILKITAKAPERLFTHMRLDGGVVQIVCGNRIFNIPGDHRSTVDWESAIEELLENGLCKELNTPRARWGRLYEIAGAGYRYLAEVEEIDRQKFAESQHVFIAATIEESFGNSDQKTTKDYVVRMSRRFVENEGIEWDYDFMLRDQNFLI